MLPNVVMETFCLDKNVMIKILFLVMDAPVLVKLKLTINVEEFHLFAQEGQFVVME